ncbi:hypothetical protein IDG86_03070 [Pelagibacterales bacterium SAG-MED13]|nr:hypothetical protein [Pelagibacterales bacterium SAG-MED13]
MQKKLKHIAIIPARKNSKGLKFKNRILFNYTAKFLKKIKWFDQIIVASDDEFLKNSSKKFRFNFYNRDKKNARDNSSIKSLMQELVKKLQINRNYILWLFYLTIPTKEKKDFTKLKNITNKKSFTSALSFISPKSHPYDCWIINKKITKFIKNDVFRRQDKIKLYEHHHYLCAFKVSELNKLNSELLNSNTAPIILKKDIIEIDSVKDLNNFLKNKKK